MPMVTRPRLHRPGRQRRQHPPVTRLPRATLSRRERRPLRRAPAPSRPRALTRQLVTGRPRTTAFLPAGRGTRFPGFTCPSSACWCGLSSPALQSRRNSQPKWARSALSSPSCSSGRLPRSWPASLVRPRPATSSASTSRRLSPGTLTCSTPARRTQSPGSCNPGGASWPALSMSVSSRRSLGGLGRLTPRERRATRDNRLPAQVLPYARRSRALASPYWLPCHPARCWPPEYLARSCGLLYPDRRPHLAHARGAVGAGRLLHGQNCPDYMERGETMTDLFTP